RADRRGLRGAQQPPLPVLVQRARRGLRRLLAPYVRPPQTEAAIQRVQRRQRQVHRRRRRPALDLQEAAVVARGVIACERIRAWVALPAVAVRRLLEPGAVRTHVARVLAARALRQRPSRQPALE